MNQVIEKQKQVLLNLLPENVLSKVYEYIANQTINGKKEGYWIEKYNGKLYGCGNFINGKKEGVWKSYFEKNGFVMKYSNANYKNDELDGLYKIWYPNGKIKSKIMFENGQAHGKYIKYYDNGLYLDKGSYMYGRRYEHEDLWYLQEINGEYSPEDIRNIVISEMSQGRGGWEDLIDA